MKRVMVFLFVLLIGVMAFAAVTPLDNEKLTMSLDLTNESEDQGWMHRKIGFINDTGSAQSAASALKTDVSGITFKTALALKVSAGTDSDAGKILGKATTNVVWQITDSEDFDVYLKSAALEDASGNTIEWGTSWTAKAQSASSLNAAQNIADGKKVFGNQVSDTSDYDGAEGNGELVFKHQGATLATGNYGYITLNIETEDIAQKKGSSYTTDLILNIVSQGD